MHCLRAVNGLSVKRNITRADKLHARGRCALELHAHRFLFRPTESLSVGPNQFTIFIEFA